MRGPGRRERRKPMLPGGHRAIGALAVLLVVLLGAAILLPLVVSGQTHQVFGFVEVCAPDTGHVPNPVVTLTDVNGIHPPRTIVGDTGGAYQFFNPPSGSYSISATHQDFFPSDQSAPSRFDGTTDVMMPDICQVRHGAPSRTLTVTVTGFGGSPLQGASVTAYSALPGRLELVRSGTTNNTGVVNLTLWPGTFQVRASHPTRQTNEVTVTMAADASVSIPLAVPLELFGRVTASNGTPLGTGVVAWLYDHTRADTDEFRMIPATVKGSLFEFEDPRVAPGTYTIIVDAKGHLAHRNTVIFPGTPPEYNVILTPAPEHYATTVLYGVQDWNNLTVWRNLTLNADSTLPGLLPPNLRSLRLQIDATFANPRNGLLDPLEISAFQAFLVNKGPAYVTTDGFFTTNGMAYNSSVPSFSVSTVGLATGPPTDGPIWINASATYGLKKPPPFIPTGAKTYFLNMTLVADTNVTTHQNYTYTFVLPRLPQTYERNPPTITPSGSAIVTGFNRFTLDPIVSGATTVDVRMTASPVTNGTVRAAVVAPTGKFHVLNATFTNYSAIVAKDTEFTFSAADSADPNGPADENNFTWRFTPNPADIRWNITTKFKYTVSGEFLVNIRMSEGDGSNVTFGNITLFVDDTLPIASIRTNRTGSGSANGLFLRVNEGVLVRFDGTLSTDLAFPGEPGVIRATDGYSWDFGGEKKAGRSLDHRFDKPGNYTVNLTVTDSVGWKSINATMTALVNDTTAPVIAFDILDPENDWTTITSPFERKVIALDASRTTDEFNSDSELNFTWRIPGTIIEGGTPVPGSNTTRFGINISFAWQDWNLSYPVVLMVHDQGFQGGLSEDPNFANHTQNVPVQIDRAFHAELRVDALDINPEEPEDGGPLTVSVNVTNKEGWATASAVTVELFAISGGVTTAAPVDSVQWLKDGSDTSDREIPPGTTVNIIVTTRLSGQGNKTLRVFVRDSTEPYTLLSDNQPRTAVNVRQPWWQPYLVVGAVIGLIVLAVFGMYARRKIKAGEWRPIRGRHGERGAEEKEKPRREVKEEKKRL
jgi:hypothetical protein